MSTSSSNLILLGTACAISASAALIFSCGGCSDSTPHYDPFGKEVVIENVKSYHDAVTSTGINDVTSGGGTVYIDFSDGLVNAFRNNDNNVDMLTSITSKLVNEGMEWFKLADGEITPMASGSGDLRKLFNTVTDEASYGNWYAPIDQALTAIAAGDKEALLITDFELYLSEDKEALDDPYVEKSLRQWLRRGNRVTFFYAPFMEKGQEKKLFFTVFSSGTPDQNSLLTKVSEKLDGESLDYGVYTLLANPFEATADYGGDKKCGLNDILMQNASVDATGNPLLKNCGSFGDCVDVICLDYNSALWNYAIPSYEQVGDFSKDKPFMQDLVMNAAQGQGLSVTDVEVEVLDVTADFTKHVMDPRLEAAKNSLVYTQDANGADMIDQVNTPAEVWSLLNLDGSPIQTYPGGTQAVNEVVQLHEELLENTMKTDPSSAEVHLLVHENFDGTQMKDGTRLLCIQTFVSGMNTNDNGLEAFAWTSPNGGKENVALRESVANTLAAFQVPIRKDKDGPMRDRAILHTYYLVLQP
jgi:hypothetical protein